MNNLAEILESELRHAIHKQDDNAIKKISLLVAEKVNEMEQIGSEQISQKSDIRVLAETMKQGFENFNARMIELREEMNTRFKELREDMNKHFEAVDKRFESVDKRFDMMFKFMSLGFTVITALIVIFKFIN